MEHLRFSVLASALQLKLLSFPLGRGGGVFRLGEAKDTAQE